MFGVVSPVYMLDKTINGHKLPHWNPWSSCTMFVGLLDCHSSSVLLVLSLETGAITPQYHVIFDDWFSTIATGVNDLPDFTYDSWAQLFRDSIYEFIPYSNEPTTATEDVDDSAAATQYEKYHNNMLYAHKTVQPWTPLLVPSHQLAPMPSPTPVPPSATPPGTPSHTTTPSSPPSPVPSSPTTPVSLGPSSPSSYACLIILICRGRTHQGELLHPLWLLSGSHQGNHYLRVS